MRFPFNPHRPTASCRRSMRCRLMGGVLLGSLLLLVAPLLAGAESSGPAALRVGVYENPPIVSRDGQDPPAGLAIDVLNEIARQEGWRLEYRGATWAQNLERLASGEIDLMVAIAYSDERARRFGFSQESLIGNWGMLVRSPDVAVTTVLDLDAKRIALLAEDIHSGAFRRLAAEFKVHYTAVIASDYPSVLKLIETGRADLGVVNRIFSLTHTRQAGLLPTSILFQPVEVRYAARPGLAPNVLRAIDRRLQALKADRNSVYYAYLERWLGLGRSTRMPGWMRWLLGGALVATLLALVFGLLLRQQVRARTAQLRAQSAALEQEAKRRRDSEEKLHQLVAASPDIMCLFDETGRYLKVSTFQDQLRVANPETMIGKKVQQILPRPVAELFLDNLGQTLASGEVHSFEYELDVAGGHRWFEGRFAPLENRIDGRRAALLVSRDISQRKRAQVELDRLAYHDALTGLPNRLLFNARLEHALEQKRREKGWLAVLFLDLDHFKNINDSFGHVVGDGVLKAATLRLSSLLRESDTLTRLGGDEFILLLERLDGPRDAGAVAAKLLEAFHQPLAVDGHELFVTASIGISLYPEDGTEVTILVRNADSAMYQAKAEGRNNYQFYTLGLTAGALEQVRLGSELRHAVSCNELELYYQPQVALEDGRLLGAEALLRWNHPQLGLVGPGHFIPPAEAQGLIGLIGEWVLRKACVQVVAWHRSGFPLGYVAVNLSGRQVQDPAIVEQVAGVLRKTGLPPAALELEITEGHLMRNTERVASILQQLAALGVGLALDDFGTGYSSLGFLKRFRIHKLKIDRSFVEDIPRDRDDMAIARAAVALGHSLQMTVVAEGIETEAQRQFLRDQGCQQGQGFLFGKPIPASAFLQRFGGRRELSNIASPVAGP